MQIDSGLFDHMVVQRNDQNRSAAAFIGRCVADGAVRARVCQDGKPVRGFANKLVGEAARGRMRGSLDGLPVGGPYEVTLQVGDATLTVCDLLVGDVWLLGGQSNMQGCGLFPKKRPPADPQVRAFYMDDRWAVAKDPIHNMWACVDAVHIDLAGGVRPAKPAPDWGVCPGPSYGIEMQRLTKGVPQGLIACAHGGTTMTQWDPKRKREGGKSLYGAMIRRLQKNGGRVAGMLWYQGCSDANASAAPHYTARMKALVAALRRDSGDKTLPVALVQIARVIGWGDATAPHWNSIQEQQRLLPQAIRNVATVPAIDLPLDDAIHLSGASQAILGVRLAYAMQVLRAGPKAGLPPIALKGVTVETARGLGVAVVTFENVVGSLRSGSRPGGLTLVTSGGAKNLFDISLEGCCARIRSTLPAEELAAASLHYGYGTDPFCTISDEAGRSLPVFGPAPLGKPRAITPYWQTWRISAFQPAAGNLATLGYPGDLASWPLTPRTFTEAFSSLRPEIAARGAQDEVVYYVGRLCCSEAMRLALILGYDGPVKAWVDGREVFHDPDGRNPATPSKGSGRFTAAAGEHEIVIALGTNKGAAWGVFARLERLDVAAKAVRMGTYTLPEIRV